MTKIATKLHPRLIVAGAARAIDFYVEALGARELGRHTDARLGGIVVNAELAIDDDVRFTLADEHREWGNHAPTSLGGTPVILSLEVSDADAVGARMQRAGAKVVFPIADQFYGRREGRFADPFGHLWIISQPIAELSSAEIQGKIDRGQI